MTLHYIYTHDETEATTGYFSCIPHPAMPLTDCLTYLQAHPLDDFMRRHLLRQCIQLSAQEITDLFRPFAHIGSLQGAAASFARELMILHPPLAQSLAPLIALEASAPTCANTKKSDGITDANNGVATGNARHIATTPLIILDWSALPDKENHIAWGGLFSNNIQHHKALPTPEATGLPPLYACTDGVWHTPNASFSQAPSCDVPFSMSVQAMQQQLTIPSMPAYTRPPAEETAALALERLEQCGIVQEHEMRHIASLSPIALLRPWKIQTHVRHGRHNFTLSGKATTYGRGLSLGQARASCLMEMVERASLYVSVNEDAVCNRLSPTPIVYSTFSELQHKGLKALNPNHFPLEVPYNNAPLAWIAGHNALQEETWVPLQMATLFSNLDEISIFDSLGSTGIATGNTMDEAKVAALTEIIERDAEAITPFTKTNCFRLTSRDPLLASLLADYQARGIQVQFQDLTGKLGVPVYKCFVMSSKGAIARGHGAGLDGKKAILSALTETPFPYPHGGPSGPTLRNLPYKELEDLPDYSYPTPAQNLFLLEQTLMHNQRMPIYVELTDARLKFPVVRAFIPHMELAADRDMFSRIPARLYANYLNLFAQ